MKAFTYMPQLGPVARAFCRAAALLAVASCLILPAWADPGYRIEQKSDFMGSLVTDISNKGICIAAPAYNVFIVMRAPQYAVLAFNKETKSYALVDYPTFHQEVVDAMRYGHTKMGPVIATSAVDGFRTTRYLLSTGGRSAPRGEVKQLLVKGKKSNYNTMLEVTKEIKAPLQMAEILSRIIDVPPELGYPLEMKVYSLDGHESVALHTESIRRTDINFDSIIPPDYPQAWSRVENEMALFMGAGSEHLAALLDDDTKGLAQDSDAKKKRSSLRWVPGDDTDSGGMDEVSELQGLQFKRRLRTKWDPEHWEP
jgi:hypothetical protein